MRAGAELLLRRPWFPGNSDIDQLSKVYQALGTPTAEAWPSVQLLPHYMEFTATPAVPLRQIFRQVSSVLSPDMQPEPSCSATSAVCWLLLCAPSAPILLHRVGLCAALSPEHHSHKHGICLCRQARMRWTCWGA